MEASHAAQILRETAAAERVGEHAASRLAEVVALFRGDVEVIERELRARVRDGLSPATDSAAHLLLAGGKRVRPLLVLLSASCFSGSAVPPVARELGAVAELVHLATLLHDDVVDDGMERRGQPTSRRLWGNAVSVLAGDLLLTHALEKTATVAPGETLSDLFRTLRKLVDGEVVQLRGRTKLDASEETYFQIVHDKTASLFAWAARSGARSAGAPAEAVAALGTFGAHLGVAFQLVDDALDYAGDAALTGKSLHADLREGKLTLPLLSAIAGDPSLLPLLEASREGDEVAAARLVSSVRASSGASVARARAAEETKRALSALEVLPESPAQMLLSAVARELGSRAS